VTYEIVAVVSKEPTASIFRVQPIVPTAATAVPPKLLVINGWQIKCYSREGWACLELCGGASGCFEY